MAVYASVLDLIGNTPIIDVTQLSPNPRVRILGKLEGQNPAGSVKDRIAKNMILEAEADGTLTPGKTIIEPSSGNTGIALAMIAQLRGYPIKIVLPGNVSIERRQLLEVFGAEIILTPGEEGSNGAVRRARELAEEHPEWAFLYQYANEANPRAHYETTGPEILRDVPDITHFVAGLGTSGTLMGVGTYLKEQKPDVKVLAVEPPSGELVEGPSLHRRREQRLVGVLAVEVDELARLLAQDGGGGHPPVDVGTRAAVGGDDAGEDDLLDADLEAALDHRLRAPGTDHGRVGPSAEQQVDGPDEQGLAGAGLPRQGRHPGPEHQADVVDEAEVGDRELHQVVAWRRRRVHRSLRPNLAFRIWWKLRPPKVAKRAGSGEAVMLMDSPTASRPCSWPSMDTAASRSPRIDTSTTLLGPRISERSKRVCGETGVMTSARCDGATMGPRADSE